MKNVLVAVIVAALLGVLGWRVWVKVGEKRAQNAAAAGKQGGSKRAVPVAVEPVRRATIRDVRTFTGTLRPDSEYEVAPKISGRLQRLAVHLGDVVKHGQLIAELDAEGDARRVEQAQAELDVAKANAEKVRLDADLEDQELVQRVAQVEAELGIARANVAECASNLNVAEREFERGKSLREQRIMSQSALDEAEARYLATKARQQVAVAQVAEKEAALRSARVRLSEMQKTARRNELLLARSQVAQKEAALRSAEVQLAYNRIHAEWGGDRRDRYVGARFVDEGTMLTSNTPILTVVDIARLRAFIYVIERDYPLIRVGQEATVTSDAYPGREFKGRIARISQVLQETSRQALVEVEVANDSLELKPGMFVRLGIEFAEHEDATLIPRAALVRHHDQEGTFLVDQEGTSVRFVPTKTGIVDREFAEILEPPLSGSVVTLGHHLLSDGAAVAVRDYAAEAAAAKE